MTIGRLARSLRRNVFFVAVALFAMSCFGVGLGFAMYLDFDESYQRRRWVVKCAKLRAVAECQADWPTVWSEWRR